MGDRAGARAHLEGLSPSMRRRWGPEHSNTATCLGSLSHLSQKQGDLPGARALRIQRLQSENWLWDLITRSQQRRFVPWLICWRRRAVPKRRAHGMIARLEFMRKLLVLNIPDLTGPGTISRALRSLVPERRTITRAPLASQRHRQINHASMTPNPLRQHRFDKCLHRCAAPPDTKVWKRRPAWNHHSAATWPASGERGGCAAATATMRS